MNVKPFYVVFCPTGPHPPRATHDTYESANAEAKRLARLHRGQRFYVMSADRGWVVEDLVEIDVSSTGEVPF